MKQLKNCIKLRSQVKIYVPSTVDVDKHFDNSNQVDETLFFLSDLFGGATCTKALGAWVSNSGELVKESVTMVFAFADQAQLEANIKEIYDYCLKLKISMTQEAIALEVNGELYLI